MVRLAGARYVGGGQSEISPDRAYIASASSLEPLDDPGNVFYEFMLKTGAGGTVKKLRMYAAETSDAGLFRRLPKIAHWAEDSKSVRFIAPGVELKLDTALHVNGEAPPIRYIEASEAGRIGAH